MTNSNQSNQTEIHSLAVKPIPFYHENPRIWLRQLEAQFSLAKISADQTKYFHLLAQLPENIAIQTQDAKTYAELRDAILALLEKSKQAKINDALSAFEIVGKPSTAVNKLKQKFVDADIAVDEELLKNRLLNALPLTLRTTLVPHLGLALAEFLAVADSLFELQSHSVYGIKPQANSNSISQAKFNSYSKTLQPFRDGQRPKICRAHIFYGHAARTCRPWCCFPSTKPRIPMNQPTPPQSRDNSPYRHSRTHQEQEN